ncbi:MAG: JAB domain-containing protein [Bacteroidota bacterium]|nr:JAB domain-containing protein [Bacteroidota bacterium]
MARPKLYDTKAKRIATVKQSGKIITFKTPVGFPETYVNQILAKGLEKRKGALKILGVHRDSNWYNSMDELLDDIEWEKMEDWHGGDDERYRFYEPVIPYYSQNHEVVLGDVDEIDLPEIKIEYRRQLNKVMTKINSSKESEKVLRSIYPEGEIDLQEQFIILYLNRQNKVLGYYRHSKGGITGTIVDIRLIMAVAVKSACTAIIISHNHPSGNTKPSNEDLNITKKITEAARLFEINVLDHLIMTSETYYSFADEGQLNGLGGLLAESNFSLLPLNHQQFLTQVLRRIEL